MRTLPWRVVFAIGVPMLLGYTIVRAQVPQEHCGNEGETPCPLSLFNAVCDTGLRLSPPRICGCALRGPFGGCLLPSICLTCDNHTRRRTSIDGFASTWVEWALRNQRDLAIDEPVNWVTHLGTHNSFNTVSDGHAYTWLPNQFYSITDQLRSGARLLTLDLYQIVDAPRLCHADFESSSHLFLCGQAGIPIVYPGFPGMRYFANGIKEIRNWLLANPNEIVFVNLENYVLEPGQAGSVEDVLNPLDTYFKNLLLDPPLPQPPGFAEPRWPTRRELLAQGRRVIVIDNSGQDVPRVFKQTDSIGPANDGWAAKNLTPYYPNCAKFSVTADAATDVFAFQIASQYTSIVEGDRVVLRSIFQNADSLPTGVAEDVPYHVINVGNAGPFGPAYTSFQLATTAGGPPIDLTDDAECKRGSDPLRKGAGDCGLLFKRPVASHELFSSLVVEERELATLRFGTLNAAEVAAAAECNASFIVFDKFSAALPHVPFVDLVDIARQAAAVWSWRENDFGQHGECATADGASGRWASGDCAVARRFACARPRSESGLDPLEWEDPLGEDWRITEGSGPWEAGESICGVEFPGYTFSVPVNGYQNRKLKDANTSASDLWLNYSQRAVPGRWAIGRRSSVDAPPVAEAGPDQIIECGFTVTLDGSASRDPQGDPLTFTWSGPFGTLTGPMVTASLRPGIHAIRLTVTDGKGGIDTDSVTITVHDTTPPTLTVAPSPSVLWPANHHLVHVVAQIAERDSCDIEPPSVELVSIVSNEDANGRGDGNTSPDTAHVELGRDDREFSLRAERSGRGAGRVYTIRYRATDLAGNQTEAAAVVTVPHDGGRRR